MSIAKGTIRTPITGTVPLVKLSRSILERQVQEDFWDPSEQRAGGGCGAEGRRRRGDAGRLLRLRCWAYVRRGVSSETPLYALKALWYDRI